MLSHTLNFVRRKLEINCKINNEPRNVTKLCYLTHNTKKEDESIQTILLSGLFSVT